MVVSWLCNMGNCLCNDWLRNGFDQWLSDNSLGNNSWLDISGRLGILNSFVSIIDDTGVVFTDA